MDGVPLKGSLATSIRANQFSSRLEKNGNESEIEIRIAVNAGACFGVVRAIKLGQAAATHERQVYSFGQLIHNPTVVADLESKGVQTVEKSSEVLSGTVILRSHGVVRETEAEFKKRGIQIVDATCPLVKKPQRIAQSLGKKGYFLVIVGDSKHPEIKGVLSYYAQPHFLVSYNEADLDQIPEGISKVGILAQTTIEFKVFERFVKKAETRFADVIAYNTICDATSIRQEEAQELAKDADIMIVVGGRNSSNTQKLVKICKEFQLDTHLIEELHELDARWFLGKKKIGVTGGASTPQEFVDTVGTEIAELLQKERD